MAKAKIEFDLADTEDQLVFERVSKLGNIYSFMFELTHNTKKRMIWEVENSELDSVEVVELVFEKIYNLIEENKLYLEDF